MKKKLVIIGNSGAARECYWLVQECIDAGEDMEFKGFLSFEGYNGELYELSKYYLGVDDNYIIMPNDVFVIGIAMPSLRYKAFIKFKERGAYFYNLIHPNVKIIGNVDIGEANIFAHGTYISCNTKIGDCNYLNGSVVVGHDVEIGSYNFFSPFCMVLGYSTVGSENNFGINCVLLPKSTVGDNNIIIPGSYIYKGFRDCNVISGNPAFVVGNVGDLC